VVTASRYERPITHPRSIESVRCQGLERHRRGSSDAGVGWLRRFVRHAAAKRSLAEELIACFDKDSEVFRRCRAGITTAGESLLGRSQQSCALRADMNFTDVAQMVGGHDAPGPFRRRIALRASGVGAYWRPE
jgi:hypothetical protein